MSPAGPNNISKRHNSFKTMKQYQNLTHAALCQYKFIPQILFQHIRRWQKQILKTKLWPKVISEVQLGQTRQKSNFICNTSTKFKINFKSIPRKTIQKIAKKITFKQITITHVKEGQTQQKANFICNMSIPFHTRVYQLYSQYHKRRERKVQLNFGKGP